MSELSSYHCYFCHKSAQESGSALIKISIENNSFNKLISGENHYAHRDCMKANREDNGEFVQLRLFD